MKLRAPAKVNLFLALLAYAGGEFTIVELRNPAPAKPPFTGQAVVSSVATFDFKDTTWLRVAGRISTIQQQFSNYLVDLDSGSSAEYGMKVFGRSKFKQFLLWGFTYPVDRWGRRIADIPEENERNDAMLTEWIKRALRDGDYQSDDALFIGHLIPRDRTSAVLCVPRIASGSGRAEIHRRPFGSENFSFAEVSTACTIGAQNLPLRTILAVARFHYREPVDSWRFISAWIHIPENVPVERRNDIRKLFFESLSTIKMNEKISSVD